ncbi:hypothetical protein ACSS6W_002075 [Trichoderma asperelloides]
MEETLTKFTLFPQLPAELRIKIWELVPRPSRVVGVLPPASSWYRHYYRAIGSRASSGGNHQGTGSWQCYHYRYIVQPKKHAIFPLLHVNREARDVWLPHFFQPSRHSRVSDLDIRFDTPFISYDTDIFTVFDGWPSRGIPVDTYRSPTILGHDDEPMDGFIALDRKRIKNVALCEIPGDITSFTSSVAIRRLPNLQNLTILALGPNLTYRPAPLASQSSSGNSLPILEMLAVDIQRGSSDIYELPLDLVHKSPFLNGSRLRHAIALSPSIRPLFRYKTFILSLLWHEFRQDNAAEAISASWWEYTEYLFEDCREDAQCPLMLSGCGAEGHTKGEMMDWKPNFEINYKLLYATEWKDELKRIGVIRT